MSLEKFIKTIPKVELHLHIEGTFEPELMFKIAERNKIKLPYKSVDELKKAYEFTNLQDFLDIYYQGAKVLLTEEDFYDLTYEYFKRVSKQNLKHAEIMFDPQTHTSRGVSFETVFNGIEAACLDAEKNFGITSKLILSILRHLSVEDAMQTLVQASDFKDKIEFIGLDSSELGHPPMKFETVFKKAREMGLKLTAHAGEEGPPQYVWQAINLLNVDRIDHGNRLMEDPKLVEKVAEAGYTLTVCPLSNLKLCVVDSLNEHPLKEMLDKGLNVTVNSDDPAYFGGYIEENFIEIAQALNLSEEDIYKLALNAIEGSSAPEERKTELKEELKRI